jgi:Arc/MetJ-type ribon-helix-helix transcriptional regulator
MADTEKITINLSVVDLGKIDVLVDEGLYSTRTDVMRTALRNLLDKHQPELSQAVIRQAYVIGVLSYGRAALERTRAKGERLDISVVGMLAIEQDVPAELADASIAGVKVRGIFKANDAIKRALQDRML